MGEGALLCDALIVDKESARDVTDEEEVRVSRGPTNGANRGVIN